MNLSRRLYFGFAVLSLLFLLETFLPVQLL